jgi:hypothetical protein
VQRQREAGPDEQAAASGGDGRDQLTGQPSFLAGVDEADEGSQARPELVVSETPGANDPAAPRVDDHLSLLLDLAARARIQADDDGLVVGNRNAERHRMPVRLSRTCGRDGAIEVGRIYVDPYTGAVLGESSKAARELLAAVERWHRALGPLRAIAAASRPNENSTDADAPGRRTTPDGGEPALAETVASTSPRRRGVPSVGAVTVRRSRSRTCRSKARITPVADMMRIAAPAATPTAKCVQNRIRRVMGPRFAESPAGRLKARVLQGIFRFRKDRRWTSGRFDF